MKQKGAIMSSSSSAPSSSSRGGNHQARLPPKQKKSTSTTISTTGISQANNGTTTRRPPRIREIHESDLNITELMRAVSKDDPSHLVKLLYEPDILKTLFDTDRKGRTALDWARICRNYNAVTLLMKAMSTAIFNARANSINSVDELEQYIMKTNHLQGVQLREAIRQRNVFLATQILKENTLSREEVEALKQVYFTDWVGVLGYTPLILAAGMNMGDVVRELIRLKAPLDHANKFGHTALTISTAAGNADITHYLIFNGADLHHRTEEGRTALHYACMYAKGKIIKMILDYMLEKFAIFRIQGHSMIDFDYTRWTTYSSILESLINARDKDFKTAEDLLPRKLDDKFRIEKRLKLSGVTGLDKLDRTKDDDRSLNTNYSHVEQEVEFFNDNMHMMYEGEAAEDNADIYDQMDDNFRYDSNLTSSNLAATKNSKHPVEQGEEEDKESVMSELSMQSKYSSMVNFSHDTDNIQHQDYLQDAYSIRTSVGLDAEVDYIVNAFDKVRERISLWQSNAEKEVALAQLIPCPLECGAICKVETMTDHVRDDCPLRTQQCHQCHQIIQFRNVEIHMKQQCPKRIVGCPNSFHGCRDLLHADQVEFHCRLHCHIRMVYCRQFCQVQIPYKDRDMHEQNYCDNRTIQCDQCHTDMLAKEYSSHLLHSCPERILKCGVGCGESFAAKDIAQHEEDVCKQVCCWVNCNQKIGPKWRLQYHEQEECLERPMTCCYECQVPTLTRRTKQNHEVTQCSLRPLPCDLGCGQTLLAKEQLSHIHTYLGSCPERLVRCPSNLVGWRIYLTSTQKEGIVLKYERKYQGQRLQHKYSAFAEDTGGESKAASSIQQEAQYTDEIYVRFVNGHKWLNIWTTDFVLLQYQLQASAAVLSSAASATSTGSTSNQDEAKQHYEQFSCDWIVYSTLTYHLSSDCPHRNVILSNSNDTQHETFGQKTKIQHAVELSELRHAMDQYLDENNADNQISVSCPYCGKDVIREDLKPHLEEACMETTFFCVLGCGEQVRRKDMETHASDLCRKRNVVCPQCNTNDLWAEELDDHIIRYCSHRIVPCPFQCELTTLLAHQSDDHIANHCPLRTVICCCGLSFLSKNLLQHELLDCAYRYVYCPQGCGKQVQHYAVENHTELECPNRHHIYQKMTECPNGCGEVMMKKELLEHCTYNCEKRIVECPQKCGNTTPLDLLKGHLVTCPQRMICCDPAIGTCTHSIYQWLYKPRERQGDNHQMEEVSVYSAEPINSNQAGKDSGNMVVVPNQFNQSMDITSKGSTLKRIQDVLPEDDDIMDTMSEMTYLPPGGGAGEGGMLTSATLSNFPVSTGSNNSKKRKGYSNDPLEVKSVYSVDESVYSEESSVYADGSAMKFRENLRMIPCRYHRCTIIMASIKLDDIELLEFLLTQIKECEDIDIENIYGDTALTLACRLGKLRFVELIIQHGADVNKETFNGRTPLIEAVKGDKEYIELIEFLIKEGAMVMYKTNRHHRTSVDWAKRYKFSEIAAIEDRNKRIREAKPEVSLAEMDLLNTPKEVDEDERIIEITEELKRILGRPRTVRILELAAIVQKQCNMLFHKISQGNNEWVEKVIQEGDFFTPNNELNAYRDMDKFVIQAEEADIELTKIQQKMNGFGNKVEAAAIQHKITLEELRKCEAHIKRCYEEERELDQMINKDFSQFELLSSKMQEVDLEEIVNFKKPVPLLVVAMYTCGLIFNLLPADVQGGGVDYLMATAPSSSNLLIEGGDLDSIISAASATSSTPVLTKEQILQNKDVWWPVLVKNFRKASEMIRKIKTFSRAKIHIKRSESLLQQAKQLLEIMTSMNEVNNKNPFVSTSVEELNDEDANDKSKKKRGKKKKKKDMKRSMSMSSVQSTQTIDTTASNALLEGSNESLNESSSKKSIKLADEVKKAANSVIKSDSNSVVSTSNASTGKPDPQNNTAIGDIVVEDALAIERSKTANAKTRKRSTSIGTQDGNNSILEEEDGIPDAEWDSDADEAMSGEWVKGEWIPKTNLRENWWDRTNRIVNASEAEAKRQQKSNQPKTIFVTTDLIQEETMKTVIELQIDMPSSSLLDGQSQVPIVEGEDFFMPAEGSSVTAFGSIPGSRAGSRGGSRAASRGGSPTRQNTAKASRNNTPSPSKRRDGSPSPSRKTKSRGNKRQSFDTTASSLFPEEFSDMLSVNPLYGLNADEDIGYHFMETILALLKALSRFALHFPAVLEKKQETLTASKLLADLRIRNERLQAIYDEQYQNRSVIEKEYVRLLKKSRFMHDKVRVYKEKVRVARLMNYVSVNGHTALSWASSYGSYDLVELILSKGGSVGYVAPIFHMVATYLQMSYKIYRKILSTRYDALREILPGSKFTANKKAKEDVLVIKYTLKSLGRAANVNLIRELTLMKIERQKLLTNIKHQRARSRFPVPEAIYTGKWEIVDRIYERRLMHNYFLNTWIYPSAPPPFRRQWSHIYEHHQIPPLEVLANGMNDISAGSYIAGEGWIGANDPKDPFGECQVKVREILDKFYEQQEKFKANRARIRILMNEAMNQRTGEQDMCKAIYKRDFLMCIKLAQDRGITIDLETPDGQTVLIGAAEEDVAGMNHTFMQNDDGRDCLAVEYLLDRRYYRPSINLETTKGYTALIRACMLGRAEVVVALLDRGADINYQNKFQRTALHYTAVLGHGKVLRILLERFANLDIRDSQNMTAYDLAERENFVNIMTLLSQFRSGNIGTLQLTRGRVNNHTLCSLGCGKVLYPFDNWLHIRDECVLRPISCPNQCGDETLMFRELASHLQTECALRPITCEQCHVRGICARDMTIHLEESCTLRPQTCPLECGRIYPACEMEKHLQLRCIHRLVPCPMQCTSAFNNVEDGGLTCNPCIGNGSVKIKKVKKGNKKGGIGQVTRSKESTATDSNEQSLALVPIDDKEEEVALAISMIRHCDVKYHVAEECVNRRVVCPNRCHSVIVQHQLPAHLQDICTYRLLICQFCQAQVKKKDIIEHETVLCGRRLVPCSDKCGEMIVYDDLPRHLREDCLHRYLSCENQCGMQIQRKYYTHHITQQCEQRLLLCPYHCLDESAPFCSNPSNPQIRQLVQELQFSEDDAIPNYRFIPAGKLTSHMKYECDHRPVRCQQCHNEVTLPYCQLIAHQRDDCRYRMVSCRHDRCLKQIPYHEREYHETVSCRFRQILCPQACGEMIMALSSSVHTHRECRLRISDCVLGCGTKVKWLEMSIHTEHECIRRHSAMEGKTKQRYVPRKMKESSPKKNRFQQLRDERRQEEEEIAKIREKLSQSNSEVSSHLASILGKDDSNSRGNNNSRGSARLPSRPSSSQG